MPLSERFVLREVFGERIVLPLDQDGLSKLRAYGVTDEGAALWHLLEAGVSEEGLVAALAEHTGQDEKAARADVDGFLEMLRELGALEG